MVKIHLVDNYIKKIYYIFGQVKPPNVIKA